jgi:hypothetical protein
MKQVRLALFWSLWFYYVPILLACWLPQRFDETVNILLPQTSQLQSEGRTGSFLSLEPQILISIFCILTPISAKIDGFCILFNTQNLEIQIEIKAIKRMN